MDEYKEIIDIISSVREDYVVSGSVATMLYIGEKTRECNDLDIHIKEKFKETEINKINNIKPIDTYNENEIIFKNGIKVDINYEDFPYQVFNGYKLVKLEKLINDKTIRSREKDLFDLKYLTKIKRF